MDLWGKFFFFLFFFLFFFVLLLLLLLLVFPPLFFNIYSNYRLFLRRKSSQNELFMTFTRVCLMFLQAQLFALSSAKLSTAIPCESPKNLWGWFFYLIAYKVYISGLFEVLYLCQDSAIGKKVFIPLSKTHSNPEEALQAQKELRELELNWHMKLFEMQREEKRRWPLLLLGLSFSFFYWTNLVSILCHTSMTVRLLYSTFCLRCTVYILFISGLAYGFLSI